MSRSSVPPVARLTAGPSHGEPGSSDAGAELPYVSVVVPARDAAATIERTCEALLASDYPRDRWELIVVDDGSTDDTVARAARFADTLVRLPQPSQGSAYARNRGVEFAHGTLLLFVNSDVSVAPDTMRLLVAPMRMPDPPAAVLARLARAPRDVGVVAGYWNACWRRLEQVAGDTGEAFWAGCGLVTREAFLAAGSFDDWRNRRAQIEAFDLGIRLRADGARILRLDAEVTRHRRWGAGALAHAIFADHACPLARRYDLPTLAASSRRSPHLVRRRRLIAGAALVAAMVGAVAAPHVGWLAALALFLFAEAPVLAAVARDGGVRGLLAGLPLHLLTTVLVFLGAMTGALLRHTLGDQRPPAMVEAYAEVGVQSWPPLPTRR